MEFAGLDPYDALRGSRVPSLVRRHPRLRQAVVQIRKRSPVDLAGLLGVTPFRMAKTLGAHLTARCRSADAPERNEPVRSLADALLDDPDIARLASGAWGYEFDVQTRWAFYPAGSPNLIATVFVARGLGSAGVVGEVAPYREAMRASSDFLMDSLLSSGEQLCFNYTLTTERLVHNANLLGAGLVAMSGALDGDDGRVQVATRCAQTTIAAQRADGSWPYGAGASLGWSDNFHTAYNLDGLLQVWLASGDGSVRTSLERGVEHWVRDFFEADGAPKYYPGTPYPYDIHSAGTAVDVAARLALWGLETSAVAESVAAWTGRNLVDPDTGATYYQKHRFATDKRHFVRWGDAHWALAESSLALLRDGRRDPLEQAVATASGVIPDAC